MTNAPIVLEQLTVENQHHALTINRQDIPEDWVDSARTIIETTQYGLEHRLMGHTFLARMGERYVGLIMIGEALPWDTDPIEMQGVPFYRVMGFVVDQDFRGQGIGGAMLEEAIRQVYRDFGKRSLALGVHRDNPRAGRFYARHGFRPTGVYESEDEYYLRLI